MIISTSFTSNSCYPYFDPLERTSKFPAKCGAEVCNMGAVSRWMAELVHWKCETRLCRKRWYVQPATLNMDFPLIFNYVSSIFGHVTNKCCETIIISPSNNKHCIAYCCIAKRPCETYNINHKCCKHVTSSVFSLFFCSHIFGKLPFTRSCVWAAFCHL